MTKTCTIVLFDYENWAVIDKSLDMTSLMLLLTVLTVARWWSHNGSTQWHHSTSSNGQTAVEQMWNMRFWNRKIERH